MIVDIRTSGHFRARFSTFAHPVTKNGPYSMLNTWPRICSLIYRIGNLFLRFPRFSDHTLNWISDCLARCPGWYSPCFLIFSPWQQVSQRRMMQQLPEADVVITNPTHFAVALKYDLQVASAPVVIAKGTDYLAQKIKEVARENKIEIV